MTRFLLVMIILTVVAPAVPAGDSGWFIARNDVELQIEADGGLLVTETITAEFEVARHGIIRVIPVRYSARWHQYALRFHLLKVTDGQGRRYRTRVKYQDNAVRIRIGDPDRTLRGRQLYRIVYRVEKALLWEDDRVKVWELVLEPGEASDLHRHDHDYYLVIMEGDLVAGVSPAQSDVPSFVGKVPPQGNTVAIPKGATEWALNVGDKTYREILVELK